MLASDFDGSNPDLLFQETNKTTPKSKQAVV
jgi:hypothetical protein